MNRILVPVPLRWGDLDAYGHVNNVAVLQLLEEARIAAFWRHPEVGDQARTWPSAILDAGPGAGTHTLVARQEIEYLLPIDYRRRPLTVEMWLGHLGGASIEVCYQLTDQLADPLTGPAIAITDAADEADEGTAARTRSVYVQATTTLVLIDATTARPRRITHAERAVWEPFLAAPVAMRRRRGDAGA